MGLFKFIKGQFIEVIEWTDSSRDTIVYRFPVMGKEIKMGAQLTVRESQVAVFVNEGKIADIFSPGKHTLSTNNMPILTKLKSWAYGFNSPFKAEVYFINTKQFTDQKWGTSNPIMMRDSEFGMIRLRAFGNYSYKVSDPQKFLLEIFGTNGVFETESINGQLKRIIISGLTDLLGESQIAALDFAMYYDELSKQTENKLQEDFNKYGLQLTSILIENISLPEEVEKVLDKRTSMGVLGNMNKYTQYQAAEALREAAQNPGNGAAGLGMGFGAGAQLGKMMGEAFKPESKEEYNQLKIKCSKCGSINDEKSKFCCECGSTLSKTEEKKCKKCNSTIPSNSKFCNNCGLKQEDEEKVCSECGSKIDLNVKFCSNCGNKVE